MSADLRAALAGQRLLRGLPPDDLDVLAACSEIQSFPAGASLAREGEHADRFFVLVAGRVVLQLHAPTGPLAVETRGAGDIVGWSWRLAPHRWTLDVVAAEPTDVVTVDTGWIGDRCHADPAFGHRLTEVVALVLVERLQATRLRLLDLYGGPRGR